jgi:uncharacterized protein YkwD
VLYEEHAVGTARIAAILVALVVVVSVNGPTAQAAAHRQARIRADARLEAKVVLEINRVRARRGLGLVRLARGLARSARTHAMAMGRRGFFGHSGPDGPWLRRIRRFYPLGGRSAWGVGENLSWSSAWLSPAAIVHGWLGHAQHRAIVLDPEWRQIGIGAVHVTNAPGVYRRQTVTIVAADFGFRIGV